MCLISDVKLGDLWLCNGTLTALTQTSGPPQCIAFYLPQRRFKLLVLSSLKKFFSHPIFLILRLKTWCSSFFVFISSLRVSRFL